MIKVNFCDGTTLQFNLNKEDDCKQWNEWTSIQDFQNRITGIGVLFNKKFFTLPLPKNFKSLYFDAELVYSTRKGVKRLIGEKVVCHADNVRAELLVYTYDNPPPPVLSRVDIFKVGRRVFQDFKTDVRSIQNV